MSENNIRSLVALLIGSLVVFLLMKNCSGKKDAVIDTDKKTVVVRLVTKVDTVRIPQNIYHTDTVRVTQIKSDTIYKNGKVAMIPAIKRVYQDSTKVADSVYVGYKATTTGTLDNMKLSYSNRKSIVVIHKTDSIFTNTTIKKPTRGLYVGVDINLGLKELSPKLEFVNNKNIYGVKYNVAGTGTTPIQNVGITYSRKLF